MVSKRSFTFCSTVAKVGGSLLPCGHPRKQGKACENGQKKIGPLGCDPTLAYSCTGKSLHNVMKRNFLLVVVFLMLLLQMGCSVAQASSIEEEQGDLVAKSGELLPDELNLQ